MGLLLLYKVYEHLISSRKADEGTNLIQNENANTNNGTSGSTKKEIKAFKDTDKIMPEKERIVSNDEDTNSESIVAELKEEIKLEEDTADAKDKPSAKVNLKLVEESKNVVKTRKISSKQTRNCFVKCRLQGR